MNSNVYEPWQANTVITNDVIVERLCDSDEGLAIYLRELGTERKFKILFDPYIAYRNMDESYRAKTFADNNALKGNFFIVANSAWMKWLHDESLGFYVDQDLRHYAILTVADCIDVISEYAPQITEIYRVQ